MRRKLFFVLGLLVFLVALGAAAYFISKKQSSKADQIDLHQPVYSHIKTWENVFTSPTGENLTWLVDHKDFLKLTSTTLVDYRRAGGTAPVMVYSNFNYLPIGKNSDSSTYLSLRQWAKDRGLSWNAWEDMFIHFSVDSLQRPSIESTIDDTTDDKFNGVFVYNGSTFSDQTENAFSGSAFHISDAIGWNTYIGYQEPFKEINVNLQTLASSDWNGIWGYWNGTTWQALTINDGTNDMQQNGKVDFTPPVSSWQRNIVNNKELWWVRLRTTAAGTTKPIVNGGGLKGRNYYYLSGSYYFAPGWDARNDTNGDGVRDANIVTNASAVFRYEARIPWWEHETKQVNMANTNMLSWYPSEHLKLLTTAYGSPDSYTYDTLFLDDAAWEKLQINALSSGGSTVEDTTPTAYQANTINMLREIKSIVGAAGKIVVINTSERTTTIVNSYVDAVDGFVGENFIWGGWIYPKERIDEVIRRNVNGKTSLIMAADATIAGDYDRSKMTELAEYYLSSGNNTYYRFGMEGKGPTPNTFQDHFYGAIEYNVGQPKGSYYKLQEADDPSSSNATYGIAYMWAREFDNALVLAVPLPYSDSCPTPNTSGTVYEKCKTMAEPSYDVVSLPTYATAGGTSNRYQKLNVDGTVDPTIITSITLRNAEGVVLVKTDVEQGISLQKSADKTSVKSGDTITYAIQYSATAQANNVIVTDAIPSDTTYVSGSASNAGVVSNNTITWNLGNLSPGVNETLTFKVTVN